MFQSLFTNNPTPLEPIPTGHPENLSPLHDVRVVFFDVYGTLVLSAAGEISKDSDPASGMDPVRHALATEGMAAENLTWDALKSAVAAHHAQSKSSGNRFPEVDIVEIWRRFLPGHILAAANDPTALCQRLAIHCERMANPTWPEPGMSATLESLRHHGIHLGIISNAQFYTPIMLEAYLGCSLADAGFHPDLCIWSYREGHAKPGARLYALAKQNLTSRLGISPECAVMVGNDMRNDIAPAAAAGFQTILYAGDKRSLRLRPNDPDCQFISPDATVSKLSQIPHILVEPPIRIG